MNLDPVRIHRILRGEDRSLPASLVRELAAMAEPIYASVMRLRNAAFDRRMRTIHALGRPTISVGNITTGGTGKTPVVRWLAEELRCGGRRPAVLMRGYHASGGVSDEQQLLDRALNHRQPLEAGGAAAHAIPIIANPDRAAGAAAAMEHDPTIDTFILDDGFQHRRVSRTYDLVLINGADPFGGGRVLPRGLLREPMSGLRRASGFLLTRVGSLSPSELAEVQASLRRRNPHASIFRCDHVHASLVQHPGEVPIPMQRLADQPFFAFCGLGDPESFGKQLQRGGGKMVGTRWFADHHPYTPADLHQLQQSATAAGATRLVTTEKDWSKIDALAPAVLSAGPGQHPPLPICVVQLAIAFIDDDASRLLADITGRRQAAEGGAKKGRTVEG